MSKEDVVGVCVCVCVISVCCMLVMSDSLRHHRLGSSRLLHPWDFSRQEYWSKLPFPFPGDLPEPRIKTESLSPAALHTDSLLSNGILRSHNNEIMPFAATWMDLEIIILSEVRERKTLYNITYMWNYKKLYK